jgi:hypothetical protein
LRIADCKLSVVGVGDGLSRFLWTIGNRQSAIGNRMMNGFYG